MSGPKQGLSVDSLFLISFSCLERCEKDEEIEKGGGDRKKKPKWHRSVAVSVDVGHAGVGKLDQSPVLHHSNALW